MAVHRVYIKIIRDNNGKALVLPIIFNLLGDMGIGMFLIMVIAIISLVVKEQPMIEGVAWYVFGALAMGIVCKIIVKKLVNRANAKLIEKQRNI